MLPVVLQAVSSAALQMVGKLLVEGKCVLIISLN